MIATVCFANCVLRLPDGWVDVTDELPPGSPPSLAKTHGHGVLQFSVATYSAGKKPGVSSKDLETMLHEFAQDKGLGAPQDMSIQHNGVASVSADFQGQNELIRAWYVSDGVDVALVTYTTQTVDDVKETGELDEANSIVDSIKFRATQAGNGEPR
jgi:hypothetical protein